MVADLLNYTEMLQMYLAEECGPLGRVSDGSLCQRCGVSLVVMWYGLSGAEMLYSSSLVEMSPWFGDLMVH